MQSPNASTLNSTRVVLARTTYTADDAAWAISARLELLLDPCAPGAHNLYRRCCSLCNLRTPRPFTRPVCSWRAQFVPLMMQLVRSPHASGFYSTRVLLARTTCIADDAAWAISARLEPLLDPCALGAHNLYRRCCSLCNLRTPRPFTRPVCSWRAQLVPLMMQLVQSPHASGFYLIRVLLARTTCIADDVACAIFERLGPLLDPCAPGAQLVPPIMQLVQSPHASSLYSSRVVLAHTTYATHVAVCALLARLGLLLDPCTPGAHNLYRR